jgi:ribosomal protein uS11/ribosomal protein uS13
MMKCSVGKSGECRMRKR